MCRARDTLAKLGNGKQDSERNLSLVEWWENQGAPYEDEVAENGGEGECEFWYRWSENGGSLRPIYFGQRSIVTLLQFSTIQDVLVSDCYRAS